MKVQPPSSAPDLKINPTVMSDIPIIDNDPAFNAPVDFSKDQEDFQYEPQFKEIMNLGFSFDREKIKFALKLFQGNLNNAVELLMNVTSAITIGSS